MSINKQAKVGIVSIAAVVILIIGFNFLNGTSVFSTSSTYYALYDNAAGLSLASQVKSRGISVGKVLDIDFDEESNLVKIEFSVTSSIEIPDNSVAWIESPGPLDDKIISLELGDSKTYIETDGVIAGMQKPSLTESFSNELGPLKDKIVDLVSNVEDIIVMLQNTFDTTLSQAIDKNVNSVGNTLQNVESATDKIDNIISAQQENIDSVMTNLALISSTIKNNRASIGNTFQNLSDISDTLSDLNVKETVTRLNGALTEFEVLLATINSGEGTVGQLIRNKSLYNNLEDVSSRIDSIMARFYDNPRSILPPLFNFNRDKKKRNR